jgi:phosphatidylglycerophosphate synthase
MSEKSRDLITIPNVLTAARLAYSPKMAERLRTNPKKWWWPTALFMASDIIDGKMARAGDTSPALARLGFRRSETGRKLDPITDKITASQMMIAGMRSGVIPKPLGGAALVQKAAISAFTAHETANGTEMHVTKLGKYTEFATNMGFGFLFAAEAIEDETLKSQVRTVAATVGALGVAGALASNVQQFMATRQTVQSVEG